MLFGGRPNSLAGLQMSNHGWLSCILSMSVLAANSICSILIMEPKAFGLSYDPTRVQNKTIYFDKAYMYMGFDSDTEQPASKVAFFPDLASKITVVNEDGMYPDTLYGMRCTSAEKNGTEGSNNCKKLSPKNMTSKYMLYSFNYTPAESFFFFDSQRMLYLDKNISLEFKLGQELRLPTWPLSSTGVLGLSPSEDNPFWSYIFKTYSFPSNRLVFNYNLKAGDHRDRYNPTKSTAYGQSELIINGYNADLMGPKGFYYVDLPKDSQYWHLPNITISLVNQTNEREVQLEGSACITNSQPELFASNDKVAEELKRIISQGMCGKDDCGSTIDYSKAKTLEIAVYLDDNDTVVYSIRPESYIYAESNKTKLSIGNMTEWTKHSCGTGFDIGLGRLFLQSAFVLFEVSKSERKKIGLGEFVKTVRANEKEKAILLGFILTCIFILICASVYSIKKYSQEELYASQYSQDPYSIDDYMSAPDAEDGWITAPGDEAGDEVDVANPPANPTDNN